MRGRLSKLWALPDFMIRFVVLVIMRLCYRLRVVGGENLPPRGPALLVPNHVTWVDALLLNATTHRRIRFVLERGIYNTPVLNWFFRLLGVIPVSSSDGKREILQFVRETRAALDAGYLVCIFAEGELTRTGMLREFRAGFERIVRDSGHPVIPVYIGGVWGSILSYYHGRLLSRPPALPRSPVTVLFGAPLPGSSSAHEVRQAVMELSCDYFDSRKEGRLPLPEYFVRTARANWKRRAIADSCAKALTFGDALVTALALSKKIGEMLPPMRQETDPVTDAEVGILLPPSVLGALANVSLSLLGRVPVNLDHTGGEASLRSAVGRCGITAILTSRAFLEKAPDLALLEGMVFIDDAIEAISAGDRAAAWLKGTLLPSGWLVCRDGFHAERTAAVTLSPGSSDDTNRGTVTHHGAMCNIDALHMVIRPGLDDGLCSDLSFSEPLGFTAALWFPLLSGCSVTYSTDPSGVPRSAGKVREHKATLLITTPSFLQASLERAPKKDFSTLRLVIVAGEKLEERVADSFQEIFGIRPTAGYHGAHLAPALTLSLPDVEVDGVRQHGTKQGSVGHPVPGLALRIVDPQTGAVLKPGEPGLILVRGSHVTLGRHEAVDDGWHPTGDTGIMDHDGFVRITSTP